MSWETAVRRVEEHRAHFGRDTPATAQARRTRRKGIEDQIRRGDASIHILYCNIIYLYIFIAHITVRKSDLILRKYQII